MHATMRQHAGIAPAAFATLLGRRADGETLIRQTPGFLQYHLVRTNDGMTSFTACAGQAGTDESIRRVAAWIRDPADPWGHPGDGRGRRGHPPLQGHFITLRRRWRLSAGKA